MAPGPRPVHSGPPALEASAAAAQVLRLAACYFDDRRTLGEAILALATFCNGRRISRSIISVVEAGDHEDTSLSVVSADRATEV
jgi:hypothetical protein